MTPEPFVEEARVCREAQRTWAERSVRERLRCVKAFRHLLVDAVDELTAAVYQDVARPPTEVLGSDVLPVAAAAKYLEKNTRRLLKPRRVRDTPLYLLGQKDVVHRRPWGVIGIIGTWNYPLFLNAVQLLQALVAGNGVLWKPSEHGQTSAQVLQRLFNNAGFPRDLLQVLSAERVAGPRLLESDIDHLVFTGSGTVGRKIAVRCAERMIPSTLELSGVDAMFVLEDADVELAARAAWFGITLNRGQTCLAVRRIFVHRSVNEAFVAAMLPRIDHTWVLPLLTAAQAMKARQLVDDARSKGAYPLEILRGIGPNAPSAAFQGPVPSSVATKSPRLDTAKLIPPDVGVIDSPERVAIPEEDKTFCPTLVVNATPEMEVCRTECFAPLAAVMQFDTIEEALALDQQCPFALGASIFTRVRRKAQSLAARLRTGSIGINDLIATTTHPATPFGGRGASGWGVTQGAEGLLAMTTPQVISRRPGTFRPHFDGPTPGLDRLLRGMLAATHAKGIGRRLRGFAGMVRGMIGLGRATKA